MSVFAFCLMDTNSLFIINTAKIEKSRSLRSFFVDSLRIVIVLVWKIGEVLRHEVKITANLSNPRLFSLFTLSASEFIKRTVQTVR